MVGLENGGAYSGAWRIEKAVSLSASRWPDKCAIEFATSQLTYGKLEDLSNRLANCLIQAGVGANDIVGVAVDDVAKFSIGALAIMKIGAIYLPIDLRYSLSRATDIMDEGVVRLLLATDALSNDVERENIEVIRNFWLEGFLQNFSNATVRQLHAPDSAAYVCYTSGSTGRPKGVVVGHAGVEGLLSDPSFVPYTHSDRIAQTTTLAFDVATLEVWGGLAAGACLVVVPPSTMLSPSLLSNFLEQREITSVWMTTSHFNALCTRDPDSFSSIDTVMIGGEAADPSVISKLFSKGTPPRRLINGYGPTEATALATWHEISAQDALRGTIPIGKPISGRTVSVRDANLKAVDQGQTGELIIGGPAIAHGYLGDLELTRRKFVDDPTKDGQKVYRTGDICRQLPNGDFEFCGRVDDQVKIRGFRVELEGVSAAISRVPGVQEAVSLARDREFGTKEILSFIRADAGLSGQQVRLALSEELQDFMIPSQIFVLPTIPLKATGKLDRNALLDLARLSQAGSAEIQVCKDSVEFQVLSIWQKVLQRNDIELYNEFWDLGGDSLSMMAMVLSVEQRFGLLLQPYDMTGEVTVKSVSRQIVAYQRDTNVETEQGGRSFLISIPWSMAKFPDAFFDALARGTSSRQLQVSPSVFEGDINGLVERIANNLLEQIEKLAPKGPYVLFGFSFSGLVAKQIADFLKAKGEDVALVVLLDAYYGKEPLSTKLHKLRRLDVGSKIRGYVGSVHGRFKINKQPTAESSTNRYAKMCASAAQSYIPSPYDGDTLLIYCSDPSLREMKRWRQVLSGSIQENVVKGGHMDMIKRDRQIREVGQIISKRVSKLGTNS